MTGEKPDNAFTELMRSKPKPKAARPAKSTRPPVGTSGFRLALGTYLADPDGPDKDRVVYTTKDFVVIRDKFPKSTIHFLILPRDPTKNQIWPQDAFNDPKFLAMCRKEEMHVRGLVAKELRRLHGKDSAKERARLDAMEVDDSPKGFELPAGRDWSDGVISGIHACPSMAHLHIHVMSRDMCGSAMNKPNHYQSFTTGFLVGLEHFPLKEDDYRRNHQWVDKDLICWRCGRDFGRSFTKLVAHLKLEFEDWKKE